MIYIYYILLYVIYILYSIPQDLNNYEAAPITTARPAQGHTLRVPLCRYNAESDARCYRQGVISLVLGLPD